MKYYQSKDDKSTQKNMTVSYKIKWYNFSQNIHNLFWQNPITQVCIAHHIWTSQIDISKIGSPDSRSKGIVLKFMTFLDW